MQHQRTHVAANMLSDTTIPVGPLQSNYMGAVRALPSKFVRRSGPCHGPCQIMALRVWLREPTRQILRARPGPLLPTDPPWCACGELQSWLAKGFNDTGRDAGAVEDS